ncbi:MAG TPA: sulfatase-like hydrolase/transferase [Vicinamibacteria bacterium]
MAESTGDPEEGLATKDATRSRLDVRAKTALVVVAALLGLLAWRATHPSRVKRDPGLSVLLVSVDTLRADALGCYGRKDAATPWIDRLAAKGVRFERARAHNVVTLPSHANLLSGEVPPRHGVRDNAGFRFPADRPTLATILRERGWRTGAFVSAFPLDSRFGLHRGFEVYDDRVGGDDTAAAFAMPERRGSRTVEAALRWIESVRDRRWFAFVHLYEPHFPYEPEEPFAARFPGEPYQGEVAATDKALAPLLEPLLAAGATSRALVVFTSDHGESLGEHGEATHGVFAYEATLRVPLVLHAPGIFSPRVVATPVRHVDVLPTVLDALGLDAPAGLPGRSLLPLAAGTEDEGRESYFESLSPSLDRGWAPLHGIVAGGLKYVDLPLPELYDLRADPGERQNLADSRPRDVEALRARLARLRGGDVGVGGRVPEDEVALERLRALGYLAGGGVAPKERYTEDDDPKRLVDLDARLESALSLYLAGDLDGAVAACEDVLRQRPHTPRAWLQLAYLERTRGRLEAAVAASRKAVDLRPLDAESVSLHGVYLTEAGRARQALAFLEPAVAARPPDVDVLTALGMAQARSGRPAEALATFARVQELDSTNAMALVNAGTVHLMSGDRERARQALEAALALDDGVARAHNGLGVIAAGEGRWAEAIERWRRAAALDPRDYQALFNLGSTLRNEGRDEEARPYLEAYLRVAPAALEGRDRARVRAWLRAGSGS